MSIDRVDDLRAFKGFIEEKLSQGGAELTLSEALDLWEFENQPPDVEEETLEALRRGFEDIAQGRVRPAREALAELRRKHGLSPRP
jgi:hypothetical protein